MLGSAEKQDSILESTAHMKEQPSDGINITPPLAEGCAVGIRHFHAIDRNRGDVTTGTRQFMITTFYPGKFSKDAPKSCLIDILRPRVDEALQFLARESGLNEAGKTDVFEHLKKLMLRAQYNLDLQSAGRFPVLIYYPGGQGHRLTNAALCETLASRGFVVFALDAPRDAPVVVFPDGRMATPPAPDGESYIWPRVADVRFLINQLEKESPAFFTRHLDTGRIGMFGHSRGGYLSNICAVEDNRIRAAVNMDGFLWGIWAQQGTGLNEFSPEFAKRARVMTTPVLRIRGDQGSKEKARLDFEEESRDFGGDFISAALHGFKHGDFVTAPWLNGASPDFATNANHPIPSTEHVQLMTDLLVDFFETYVTGRRLQMTLMTKRKPAMDVFFRLKNDPQDF